MQNPKVEVGELSNVYRLAGTMRQAKMIMDLTRQFLTSSCIKHQVSEPDEDDRSLMMKERYNQREPQRTVQSQFSSNFLE